LVGDVGYTLNLRREIFDHTFVITGVNAACKCDFTVGNLDFDLGRIDLMVTREKVTDFFFDSFVRSAVTLRPAAGFAFERRFAAPSRLALVGVSGITTI
jgi:hypothetical protein